MNNCNCTLSERIQKICVIYSCSVEDFLNVIESAYVFNVIHDELEYEKDKKKVKKQS